MLNAADDQVIDAIKNITHGTMAQVVSSFRRNSAIRNTLEASFAGRISRLPDGPKRGNVAADEPDHL